MDINHLSEFDRIAIDAYINQNGGTVEEAVEAINKEIKGLSKKRIAELEAEADEDAHLTEEEIAEIDAICDAGNNGTVYLQERIRSW